MLDDMGIATGRRPRRADRLRAPRAGHRRPGAARARSCASGPAQHARRVEVRQRERRGGGRKHTERALQGTWRRTARSSPAANKLFVRDRLARLLDDGSFVEDGLLANALADDLPADGVVTGTGRIDGRPVCVMANDSTVKAGSWGARTVEKIVRLTETALQARAAGRLPRRLRGRPHHRPGRALPGPARRGPHLRQPGAALGPGAAGVLPVRAVGRGRCVHPRVLRRRVHGGGQRLDVPRLAADGGRGDRRGRDARRDGRRRACTRP